MSVPTPAVLHRLRTLPAAELPAYLYDLVALRDHTAAIRSALPDAVELYYAAKANPEPEILAALAGIVDGFEVSSGGELAHVAAAAPAAPLAIGGPGKTYQELAAALDHRVHRIHVESETELRMLSALAATRAEEPADVLLRVNLPVTGAAVANSALTMGGRPTPFGMDPRRAYTLAADLVAGRYPGVSWRGVHAHLASGLNAADLLTLAESIITWSQAVAQRCGVDLDEVNLGGGMNVDYRPGAPLFDWTTYGDGLARITETWPRLQLRIEPGRAVSAYCGWYATEVLDVKPSHGTEFAIIRGGTHHLRTPAAKGHDQPCTIVPIDTWPHQWPRPTATGSTITITGQLCTPKDILARNVPAEDLQAGHRLAFGLAGAYAWNISHHKFLMHPPPSFHFLDTDHDTHEQCNTTDTNSHNCTGADRQDPNDSRI